MTRIMLLFAFCVLLSGCRNSVSVIYEPTINKHYLLLLHNKERCQRDIEQIEEDDELNNYAQRHAEWMAKRSTLKHSNLDIKNFSYLGENIAMGQTKEDMVLDQWMNSSGHKRNILDKKYKKAGIGYAKLSGGSPYWCVVFGG